jgi:hypothetical protein
VAVRRDAWIAGQPNPDPEHLVFLDETSGQVLRLSDGAVDHLQRIRAACLYGRPPSRPINDTSCQCPVQLDMGCAVRGTL